MLSFLYVYSDHSILECYNLFSGVELSMRSFFVISAMWFMSIQSIYFCEPLKVGHLPYLFLGANVAKIIRCVSLQSWSFFLSHCKFYSVFSRKRFSWPGLFRTWFIFSDWFLHVSFSRFQYSNLQFGSLLHSFLYWLRSHLHFFPLYDTRYSF